MRAPAAAGVLVAAALLAAPAAAGPLVLTDPSARMAVSRFELEYLRPWAGLPVQRGRLAFTLPVGGGVWLGTELQRLATPTVEETELGLVLRLSEALRASAARRRLQVAGLEGVQQFVAALDLRLRAGLCDLGASAEIEETPQRASPLLRREIWLGLDFAAGSLTLSRRSTPWARTPRWGASVQLRVTDGLRLGLLWSGLESSLAIELRPAALAVTALTAWTGPRAGSLGLRIAEAR